MGVVRLSCILLAGVQLVQGHNSFVRISVNGKWQEPFRFIRNKTEAFVEPNGNPEYEPGSTRFYMYPTYPEYDLVESSRCGRDHMAHAGDTDILPVKAGDDFEVAVTGQYPDAVVAGESWGAGWLPPYTYWEGCYEGRGICRGDAYDGVSSKVFHEGPVLGHLSKVPEGMDVREYDGAGDWVKIWTMGPQVRPGEKQLLWWPNNNYYQQMAPPRYRFSLPEQTPPGQYLLRLDTVWPGRAEIDKETGEVLSVEKLSQVYASCVHIDVESEAAGSLPKGITIPDDMVTSSPGMHYDRDIASLFVDLGPDWVYPGGPLWDGERYVQDKPPPMS